MTKIGHHRSAALAERHRRAIEKEVGVPVVIASRRNAKGQFSDRGHTFIFEWEKEVLPPPPKLYDWLIIWHYKGQPARDIGFIAVARTEDDALMAVSEFMANDKFAQRIPASGFHNWTVARVERQKPSANAEGYVEYREQEQS